MTLNGFCNVGSLAEGENKLWVSYSYNNGPTHEFYHSFTVEGLPSLYITESIMNPLLESIPVIR